MSDPSSSAELAAIADDPEADSPRLTRAGRSPRKAVIGMAVRGATDRRLGRPTADQGLTKAHLRTIAALSADREKLADIAKMQDQAERDRNKHVRQALSQGIAKALIARTLGVSATTVSKLYGAGS